MGNDITAFTIAEQRFKKKDFEIGSLTLAIISAYG